MFLISNRFQRYMIGALKKMMPLGFWGDEDDQQYQNPYSQ
jgi:hypothetical protein